MTSHPQRRTQRPARRPVQRRTAKPTIGTNLTIGGIALLVATALIQAHPQIATAVIVAGGLAFIAATRKPAPRRHALPDGTRPLAMFQAMHPTQFEHAIADLAREDDDVAHAEVVGGANDRAADVLVTLHDRRRILIQCKKYKGPVRSQHVQIVNGTYRDIHRCDLGIIVTTAGFTAPAIDTNECLQRKLRLIDGAGLTAWANGGRPPWQ